MKKGSIALVAVALIGQACGADGKSAPVATLGATTTAAPASSSADSSSVDTEIGTGSAYNSTTFAVPFDVELPAWLPPSPSAEEPNFVTWEAADAGYKVRFLVPVNVYPPGGNGTTPPPQDYLAYLRGQSDHGARFADVTQTTVGGRPATILTATTDAHLDGSLGCQAEGMNAGDCWGIQPDLRLRIAVIPFDGKTLLVWLRGTEGATEVEAIQLDSFEQMLASIRFSDRPVQTTVATATVTTVAPAAGFRRSTALDRELDL